MAERLLPVGRRRAWSRDRVWFHIDELNAQFDLLQPDTHGEVLQHRISVAQERIRLVTTAARWSAAEFREEAWRLARQHVRYAEDAFGPAIILLALGPTQVREQAEWLRKLPVPVTRALALLGLEIA
jgi:hypothetical protein